MTRANARASLICLPPLSLLTQKGMTSPQGCTEGITNEKTLGCDLFTDPQGSQGSWNRVSKGVAGREARELEWVAISFSLVDL